MSAQLKPHHPLAKHPLVRHPLAQQPLGIKLAIVTAIKLLVLLALWWAFFSGHGETGMTPDRAAAAILHPKISNTTE